MVSFLVNEEVNKDLFAFKIFLSYFTIKETSKRRQPATATIERD